eukprot:CAMPEP_0114572328 /NCGR_PEP_ID=MMETSP0114-20121206/18231_1 /TAXON_ID=31324 /ORGANISM="Goniomonas sp, Strain m" /LENGTH=107 /DNA_ID=CAMNT_0001759527 /DNA_START=12 /DNA_END=332 /DNA_ORIENTATION=+
MLGATKYTSASGDTPTDEVHEPHGAIEIGDAKFFDGLLDIEVMASGAMGQAISHTICNMGAEQALGRSFIIFFLLAFSGPVLPVFVMLLAASRLAVLVRARIPVITA